MSVVVDEAAREALIRDEAKAANMTDMDLLKIAKRGLGPAEAVADLRTRYPAAFKPEPIKRAAEMTPVELQENARKLGVSLAGTRVRA